MTIREKLVIIKKDKQYIDNLFKEGYNDSDYCVYTAKSQLKHDARQFGLTYMQACKLANRYSWHDLGH